MELAERDCASLDDVSKDIEIVLKGLLKFKAMTIEQITDILLGGKSRRGYYVIEKLKKQKLIRVDRVPERSRQKYVVLSKRGAEELDEDLSLHEYYVRREKAEEILCDNEIYKILTRAGVKGITSRKDALDRLGLQPIENALRWLFEGNGVYAVYARVKGNKTYIVKSIKEAPSAKIDGHIVVYNKLDYLYDDTRDWLKSLPAPSLYLTTMDGLGVARAIMNPTARLNEFTDKIRTFVSSGEVVKTKDAPLPLAWQKGKNRMLLCDLAIGDITGPALMLPYSAQEIKRRGWGEGVIYHVEDRKSAQRWLRLLGRRECNYFITQKDAGLYGVKDERLVRIR